MVDLAIFKVDIRQLLTVFFRFKMYPRFRFSTTRVNKFTISDPDVPAADNCQGIPPVVGGNHVFYDNIL
jgi:hypothetical protein